MKKEVLKKSFIKTIPVLTGYIFLGISYGIYATSKNLPFYFPMITSLFVYAGSMEFVLANLLAGVFNPFYAILLTLMVNARHVFYGLSMLSTYNGENIECKHPKLRKFILIFGLTDETFSVSYQESKEEKDINTRRDMLISMSLLDHLYWFLGASIGAIFGSFIKFNTTGIDFVMTALFVIILINQFKSNKSLIPGVIGILVTLICLIIFGKDIFLLPALVIIVGILLLFRKRIEKKNSEVVI